MSLDNYITVADAAKTLKVTTQHVRTLIRNNQLQGERIGSQWVVSRAALVFLPAAVILVGSINTLKPGTEETASVIGSLGSSGAVSASPVDALIEVVPS